MISVEVQGQQHDGIPVVTLKISTKDYILTH